MAINLTGIVDWLSGWFYTKEQTNTYLNAKANKNLTNANQNVVTDSSGNITTEAKPTIPDVTVKADKSGGVQQVTDANAHSNIGTSTGATQGAINTAIDTVIGSLSSIQAVKVVSSLPTASASTMGSLYIVSENSKINVYYTKQSGTGSSASYTWQKMDSDILDELSIAWSDVTGKPTAFNPTNHASTSFDYGIASLNYYGHVKISADTSTTDTNGDTALSVTGGRYLEEYLEGRIVAVDTSKAPVNHARVTTSFGVGTTTLYGHNKIIDNLTSSSLVNGESLSAHQGYVLKGLIDDKQDVGDCITSIELVPKTTDSTGAIRLYYGDEE